VIPCFDARVAVKHTLAITGRRFRLRPVTLSDAEFIVALRTDPRRSAFIHAISGHLPDQVAWLERYFERPGDYYFVIERLDDGKPVGTIGLYDVDAVVKSAEWGRWVVQVGSRAGVEGLLLLYRVAFEQLDLEVVYSRTVTTNQRALAIHTAYGLTPHRVLPQHVRLGASLHDAIEHRLMRSAWPAHEPALEQLAAVGP
jgi:RimJ/RimL family protein N-acetyltransferase